MKTLFSLLIFLLLITTGKAQDTLVKRNGETLVVKLTEINPTDVHYRLFSYQDGPAFTLPKEEIRLLIYANGYRESYESYLPPLALLHSDNDISIQMRGKHFYYKNFRVRESDMLGIAAAPNDKKLNRLIRRVDEIRIFQIITGVAAIGLVAAGDYIYNRNAPRARRGRFGYTVNPQARKNGAILMICGVVSSLLSVSFMIERRHNDRFVVSAYNELVRH